MPIDIENQDALQEYLRRSGRVGPGEELGIRRLAGGVSNRTVLVTRPGGEAWVLKQALEKLRVAVDWFSSPERVHREAEGMRRLFLLAPPGSIPEFLFEDHECHLLAMRAVPEPHQNWKSLLLAGALADDQFRQFGELLGTVHRRSRERSDEIAAVFADRSFFESLRLEPYYGFASQREPAAAAFLDLLIDETRARREALVHGDYSPKNVLVHGGRLVLLDHEVIHFGDPAFDLGFAITHLLSKAHHSPARRAAFARAARLFLDAYAAAAGGLWTADLEARAVRHTLACLLARVAGRSPLEYLDAAERERQRRAVLALLDPAPAGFDAAIEGFLDKL
jgi:hypothetical protein